MLNIAVIGGGLFGVTSAIRLSEKHTVTLFESNQTLLDSASKHNHNRLHFGYHYPRSYKTAKQSLDGYKLFKDEFESCIINNFPNYYLIDKNSRTTAEEYINFCDALCLKLENKKPELNMNFNDIEASFLTDEPIFNYDKIKIDLLNRVDESSVRLCLNKTITDASELEGYDVIINTTYHNINKIKSLFNLPIDKLNIQDVVIPIFKYNSPKIGITIMDGKFFSILPKGLDENVFLLYSVEHSVINSVNDFTVPETWVDRIDIPDKVDFIYNKSENYFPFLKDVERIGYYRTVRALPFNDDDERLSYLDVTEHKSKLIISVLSGKITTCWLIADDIVKIIDENCFNRQRVLG
jgi:hypothetical protein